jgi:hypothetical protein
MRSSLQRGDHLVRIEIETKSPKSTTKKNTKDKKENEIEINEHKHEKKTSKKKISSIISTMEDEIDMLDNDESSHEKQWNLQDEQSIPEPLSPSASMLQDRLKTVRSVLADTHKVYPNHILLPQHIRSLSEMQPIDMNILSDVIGKQLSNKYGYEILNCIRTFRREQGDTSIWEPLQQLKTEPTKLNVSLTISLVPSINNSIIKSDVNFCSAPVHPSFSNIPPVPTNKRVRPPSTSLLSFLPTHPSTTENIKQEQNNDLIESTTNNTYIPSTTLSKYKRPRMTSLTSILPIVPVHTTPTESKLQLPWTKNKPTLSSILHSTTSTCASAASTSTPASVSAAASANVDSDTVQLYDSDSN